MRHNKSTGAKSVTCHDGHAIGLDIGATAVRAAVVKVRTRDGHTQVTSDSIGGVALSAGVVDHGMVTNPAALTEALTQLWRTNGLKCRNVILGVANSQVLVRGMAVPDLGREQRAQALPFQAKDVVALPLDEVVLDFAPLGIPDPTTKLVEGLLVASPRKPVIDAVAAVEKAGLNVVRVDLASFAVLRSTAEQNVECGAVIDFGAHLTTVVIHRNGVPALVRTLARGGDELTDALVTRLQISRSEAETAKCTTGLGASGEVSAILGDAIAPLLGELRSSVNYFGTSNPGSQIKQVSMTGGASSLLGLAEKLSSLVGAPCEVVSPVRLVDPLSGKARSSRDDSWATALSVGLAMGAAA
jgi:type IV pilus assembly protein PilM